MKIERAQGSGSATTTGVETSRFVKFDKKMYELLLSSAVASSICFFSVIFAVLEIVGVFHIAHPLFWGVIATGSLGVSGSSWIYLRRLLRESDRSSQRTH